MPFGISQSQGRWWPSNSLDNTIRIVRLVPTEWVLVDIRVEGVANGFGHGTVYLWAEDGTLLATASQSALVRSKPEGHLTPRGARARCVAYVLRHDNRAHRRARSGATA